MIGIGIVGYGVQGRAVAAELDASPVARVVAIHDPFADAAIEDARRRSSLGELVNDADVDLVYLATPPAAHEAGVAAAAAAGRAVVCEKPLAPDTGAAARIVRAVTDAGIPFGVNFYFATAPAARRLVAAVAGGRLGTVSSLELTVRFARWPRAWQADAGAWLRAPIEGGFTREVVSHFVYLADRIGGPGHVVRAHVERGADGLERRVVATVQHGAVAFTIDAAVEGADEESSRLVVNGTRAIAALLDWDELEGELPPAVPLTLAEAFAAVAAGRRDVLPDAACAARVVATIEAILA
jgi:predicted dehydrogenase